MEKWSQKLNLKSLLQSWGSPYYVFNKPALKKNVEAFTHFVGKASNIYFPIKANPSKFLLNELHLLGTSFDCASPYEIQLVRNLEIPPSKIIYNSPVLEPLLASKIFNEGASIVIDSEEIYDELKKLLKDDSKGHLFLRVHPDISLEYQTKKSYQKNLAHASHLSKFGLTKNSILKICQDSSFPISGLHIHSGSRMDNLASFKQLMHYLHELAEEIFLATGHKIKQLNVGGGLGINFTPFDAFPTLEQYVNELAPLKKNFEYFVEPGNALVGNTIGLLTQVKYLKQLNGKRWALIDVGANQLINLIALGTPHQILDKNNNPLPLIGPDSIGGPLCFAGDIVLPQTNLDTVRPGDPLFIQHCGSYCYALSNDFNGQMTPGLLVLDENKIYLTEEKQAPFNLAEDFKMESIR